MERQIQIIVADTSVLTGIFIAIWLKVFFKKY